jgi:glycosyltransferase involved in cell wall biosynthesis
VSVSFVVTVYNKARFLPRVLTAVAAEREQTGGEIVIVNDGSTDASATILEEFAGQQRDIRVLHQENRGVAAATNMVVNAARQPFIRLVDGDDIIATGSTRQLLHALIVSQSGYAFGDHATYDPGVSLAEVPRIDPDCRFEIVADPLAQIIRQSLFVPSSTLGRKAVYDIVLPLPEQYRTSQDYALGLRVAQATLLVQVHQTCCYLPCNAPGRLSSSKARMFRDTVRMSRDLFEAWPLRYRGAAVRRNAGRAYHYARRHLPGSQWRCASLAAIRLAGYLPISQLHPVLMDWIADAYEPAILDPDAFP